MKLKRILAGIIACTMVATAMGVTAFAADTEPTDVVTTTETEILAGDIDNDGDVDMQDALTLARYLVSGDEDTKANFAQLMGLNLDAVRDENGDINITSAINVLKEVVKTIPVETTPEETTVDTDETTVDTDETTVDTDETTVDTDETTVDTDETTVDTDETTVDTDETTVDTDETTVETTTEETTVVTEDPELVESAKADLDDAIEIGDVERLNEEYTEDSWLALDAALKAAKAVKEDATIAEIVAATEALTAAINGLVTEEDLLAQKLEDLAALVATAEEKVAAEDEENPYDAGSFADLSTAIFEAKNVIMFSDQTLEDATIAFDELTTALAGLKTQAQVVKEAGVALKADIVIAKKYQIASGEDATIALNTAITAAEAMYSRTGNIIAGKTMVDVETATANIKRELVTIIETTWAGVPTVKDNAADTYEALASALIDAGYFGYEDIFTAAGLTLDEVQTAALELILAGEDADTVAVEVEGFYAKIIATKAVGSVSINGFDTIKETDAVFQAFKTKVNAAAATVKADTKKAYDDATTLGTKANIYTVESLEGLNGYLTGKQTDFVDLSIDIVAGTNNVSKVKALAFKAEIKTEVANLVSLEDEKAKTAKTELLVKLDEGGMYADMITIAEGKLTFKGDYKTTITPANQATYLIAMQQAYDVLKNNKITDAATLTPAITTLSTNLLAAKKTYLNAIAANMVSNTYTNAIKTKVTSSSFITEANINDSIAIVKDVIASKKLTDYVTGVAITGSNTRALTVTLNNGVALTISGVTVDEETNVVSYPAASTETLTALLGTATEVIEAAALAEALAEAKTALDAAIEAAGKIELESYEDGATEKGTFTEALTDAKALFVDGKLVAGKTVSDVTDATTALNNATTAVENLAKIS